MDEKGIKKIEEIFARYISIFSENIRRKLDILIEYIRIISEKLDRMGAGPKGMMRCTHFDAHRADTEIHKIGYQVRESRD